MERRHLEPAGATPYQEHLFRLQQHTADRVRGRNVPSTEPIPQHRERNAAQPCSPQTQLSLVTVLSGALGESTLPAQSLVRVLTLTVHFKLYTDWMKEVPQRHPEADGKAFDADQTR